MDKAASPSFQRQVENLQTASLDAMIPQIEKLNSKEISFFLSNLSTANDPEKFNGNHKLAILNVLVRSQGRNIVPYIDPIMSILIQAVEFSTEHSTFALPETCSRLTCAIAQYGIDPLIPECERIKVVSSLCMPLSDSLMSAQKNVASVCAFCIRALAESNNWKYVSSKFVNQICSKVTGALEEDVGRTKTGAHLGLVISLVKQNPFVIEPYVRSLIKSGLFFLTDGATQTKESSLEMIYSIMKYVDPRAISSEIGDIVIVLENLRKDSFPEVSAAIFEALKIAKTIEARRSVRLENSSSPVAGLIVSPKMGNACNYGSYGESNSSWEMMSAKDECSFKSTGRQVNGFVFAGSETRGSYPIEAMEASPTRNIFGSYSDGWRMARCTIHDQHDKCIFEKNTNHLNQRIRRHNSVDNLRVVMSNPDKGYFNSNRKMKDQFCLSPDFLLSQDPLISPESAQGNLLQDISSKTEKRMMDGGNLYATHMPFCKVCERKKRGGKRCCFEVLKLVWGILAVLFAISFWVWWLEEDQAYPLVPT